MKFLLRTSLGETITIDGAKIGASGARVQFAVDLGHGHLRPGLINAHDHLYRNHYPRLGSPPYRSAYEWAKDIHSRFSPQIERAEALERGDAVLFGALKNLIGGVTCVVHHDRWDASFCNRFPLRLARVRVAHSLRLERNLTEAIAGDRLTRRLALSIHLAEGTDREAADEVREAGRKGIVNDQLIAVHAIGVDSQSIELLRTAKAAVVWCPTSNNFLFGRTTPPALFEAGIDVLLGTDSLLTGDGTLLDELRQARETGYIDDERLRHAVGTVAARRLGLQEPTLAPDSAADIVFLRRPLFEAHPRDVGLVLVRGKPRFGDVEFADVFDRSAVPVEPLEVGGIPKLVAAPLATVAAKVLELSPECTRIFQ